jgi:hypothetical protein
MSEEYKAFIDHHLSDLYYFGKYKNPFTRNEMTRARAVSFLSGLWRKQKEIYKNIQTDPKYYKYVIHHNNGVKHKYYILYDREKAVKLFSKYAKEIGMSEHSDSIYYMLLRHKDGDGHTLIKELGENKRKLVGIQIASKKNNIYEGLGQPFKGRKL